MTIKKVKSQKGDSWGFDLWVTDGSGVRTRLRRKGFATKAEADAVATAIKHRAQQQEYGLACPQVDHMTIGGAVEAHLTSLTARWRAERGADYVRKNIEHLNSLRRWAEFAGTERRVSSLQRKDFEAWVEHESLRGLQMQSIRWLLNAIIACLNHPKEICDDLTSFHVPKLPRGVNVDYQRTRVLSDDEIKKFVCRLVGTTPEVVRRA